MIVKAGLRCRSLIVDDSGSSFWSFIDSGRPLVFCTGFGELLMSSPYGLEGLRSHKPISVQQNLSSKWMLRAGIPSTARSTVALSTRCHVSMAQRKGRTSFCDGPSCTTYEGKRWVGSLREKMGSVRVAGGGWALPSLDYSVHQVREHALLTGDGPSCIFVGPLETAEKARLEALYQQARDSYYSGSPLILDDMFDRIEIKLRWHGSKLVLKYPRCSLKRYSAYADAELDSSQMWALVSVWSVLLASGVVAATFPPACAITKACQKAVYSHFDSHKATPMAEALTAMNAALAVGIGLLIGIPVAVAAARSLQGLWSGDLMALKGNCPNCAEEVYAFVRADLGEHKTECHVCEQALAFRVNVERSIDTPGRVWAYGRVYLLIQPKDLTPKMGPSGD